MMSNIVWPAKGRLIRVKSMECEHIRNTIKTLRNSCHGNYAGKPADKWIETFKNELERRDKMANLLLEPFTEFHKIYQSKLTGKIRLTTKIIKNGY